ncbi:MAG: uncharacterized protein A8A55_1988 [Amphiamblys sp. WSBS2006]|nr:MAG: uncharacterized protein A8A55_1988 [Amphiamblys sp. WSBS2006]
MLFAALIVSLHQAASSAEHGKENVLGAGAWKVFEHDGDVVLFRPAKIYEEKEFGGETFLLYSASFIKRRLGGTQTPLCIHCKEHIAEETKRVAPVCVHLCGFICEDCFSSEGLLMISKFLSLGCTKDDTHGGPEKCILDSDEEWLERKNKLVEAGHYTDRVDRRLLSSETQLFVFQKGSRVALQGAETLLMSFFGKLMGGSPEEVAMTDGCFLLFFRNLEIDIKGKLCLVPASANTLFHGVLFGENETEKIGRLKENGIVFGGLSADIDAALLPKIKTEAEVLSRVTVYSCEEIDKVEAHLKKTTRVPSAEVLHLKETAVAVLGHLRQTRIAEVLVEATQGADRDIRVSDRIKEIDRMVLKGEGFCILSRLQIGKRPKLNKLVVLNPRLEGLCSAMARIESNYAGLGSKTYCIGETGDRGSLGENTMAVFRLEKGTEGETDVLGSGNVLREEAAGELAGVEDESVSMGSIRKLVLKEETVPFIRKIKIKEGNQMEELELSYTKSDITEIFFFDRGVRIGRVREIKLHSYAVLFLSLLEIPRENICKTLSVFSLGEGVAEGMVFDRCCLGAVETVVYSGTAEEAMGALNRKLGAVLPPLLAEKTAVKTFS